MSVNTTVFLSLFLVIFVLPSCLFTLGQLVLFLSSQKPLQLSSGRIRYNDQVGFQVALDLSLVALFALQHSLQCSKVVKGFLSRKGCDPIERLLYNLGSCIVLQVLMRFWQPIPGWVVWEAPKNDALWWLFTIIHTVAWSLVYGGCCVMDLTEMLGVKQVIYALQNNPTPLSLKSDGLRRFYSHMRHPGFCALSVILFAHPVMQLDRLLLAHGLIAYVIWQNQVDSVDQAYVYRVQQRKERDLYCN